MAWTKKQLRRFLRKNSNNLNAVFIDVKAFRNRPNEIQNATITPKPKKMDNIEFEKTVANMRWAQKGYFKTPSTEKDTKKKFLVQSKGLEAKIDAELKLRGYAV